MSELTRSSDPNIAGAARHSLWNIDPETARKAENWTRFASERWGFSSDFPGKVEMASRKAERIDSDIHEFFAWCGTSRFGVALSFVLPDAKSTVTERYEMAAQFTADAVNGTVEHNGPIEQHGLRGRDQKIVVKDHVLRARVFVVGDRVYQAQVVYMPGLLHSEAVEYFLNSFTITWQSETNDENRDVDMLVPEPSDAADRHCERGTLGDGAETERPRRPHRWTVASKHG
ncbi:MAG: hypothetical protein EA424_06405 [Planctomycetaceae bacterium]|nr:MAG: hypothetical protein EA424_06405 [Planctomycetaceae bacterium]